MLKACWFFMSANKSVRMYCTVPREIYESVCRTVANDNNYPTISDFVRKGLYKEMGLHEDMNMKPVVRVHAMKITQMQIVELFKRERREMHSREITDMLDTSGRSRTVLTTLRRMVAAGILIEHSKKKVLYDAWRQAQWVPHFEMMNYENIELQKFQKAYVKSGVFVITQLQWKLFKMLSEYTHKWIAYNQVAELDSPYILGTISNTLIKHNMRDMARVGLLKEHPSKKQFKVIDINARIKKRWF